MTHAGQRPDVVEAPQQGEGTIALARNRHKGTLHEAIWSQIEAAPRRLALKIIETKLKAAGASTAEITQLPEYILDCGVDTIKVGNPPVEITLELTSDDQIYLDDAAKKLEIESERIISDAIKQAASDSLEELRASWLSGGHAYEISDLAAFRIRLEDRWQSAFRELRLLNWMCRQLGEKEAAALGRSRSKKPRLARNVISALHARGCRLAGEIETLMTAGYADGALARWRSLHETFVTATLIKMHGEDLAVRYVAHEHVEAYRAAQKYQECAPLLGYSPFSSEDLAEIESAYRRVINKYGDNFRYSFGWAAEHLEEKNPQFRHLEAAAEQERMRSHYKMASYSVHADIKSITWNIGNLSQERLVHSGPSNAGLHEPGQNAAITMTSLSALVVNSSIIDDVVPLKSALNQCGITVDAFLEAGERLRRDHFDCSESTD